MANNSMGVKSSTYYTVETNFPNSDYSEEKNNEFRAFAQHAYTHVDDPGDDARKMLINTHAPLFKEGLVGRDSLSYTTVDQARKVADFLHLYGRLTAGWAHNSQEFHRAKYRHPLKVRIVENHHYHARRLMEFVPTPLVDPYEIELAKLKEKYGKV